MSFRLDFTMISWLRHKAQATQVKGGWASETISGLRIRVRYRQSKKATDVEVCANQASDGGVTSRIGRGAPKLNDSGTLVQKQAEGSNKHLSEDRRWSIST